MKLKQYYCLLQKILIVLIIVTHVCMYLRTHIEYSHEVERREKHKDALAQLLHTLDVNQ